MLRPGPELSSLPQLVDVTYSATSDPSRYEDLIQVWEAYMAQLDPGDIENVGKQHLRHFNQALTILEQIGRTMHQKDRQDAITARFSCPAYIVDRALNILQVNAAAARDRITSGHLQDRLDPRHLKSAFDDLISGAPAALFPLHDEDGKLIDCAVLSSIPGNHGAEPRFLLVLDGGQDCLRHLSLLRDKFNLTASETDVLAALLQGQSAAEISDRRGVGLATTRTQVRRLLEKTGSATLSDMIRQMGQLSARLSSVAMACHAAEPDNSSIPDYDRILTADGRLIAYRDFGDPRGRPVLFIHNMMGGAIWPERMEQIARRRNWRIIAPSRPGFGLSDNCAARDMDLVRKTCSDMLALLDYLMIDKVLVVGMLSSAGLGLRFATDHADRTAALLNVGHGGLMDDRMIAAMENPARVMAKTYRKSPTALRFLIRVAVASVDLLGPQQMLRSNFSTSPADAELLNDAALVDAIGAGLQHAIAQGGEAFSRDGFVALHDFRAEAQALACPAVCLLGSDDVMYPVQVAKQLFSGLDAYRIELFENAGQFVFYHHPERAFDLMDRLMRQANGYFLN